MRVKGVVVAPSPASPGAADGHATHRIANRPIVCHTIEAVASAGLDGIVLIAPAHAMSQLRTCIDEDLQGNPTIAYVAVPGHLDLLCALRAAAPFVGEDGAIVHLADGLLDQQLDRLTEDLAEDAPDLRLLLHRSNDSRDGLDVQAQKLLGLSELNGLRSRLALAGVCLFGPGGLRRVAEVPMGPSNGTALISIAEYLVGEGRALDVGFVHAWRRYRGDPLDLLELNRLVLDQQAAQGEAIDHGDNRIEGRVVIDPTAEVISSIIVGPCIIGPRTRVVNSYIGPYTSIGGGAEIEGAEIVRSIVADGARIMHIGGRIEGSTIGRRASIFRDFGLPRAMRLHVGEGVEMALQ